MSLPSRIRVALLGCGRIAHVHCGYLRQLAQVEFAGACDSNRAAREAFTARWQAPTYADVDELLAAAQPDVVHVLTPPATHASLAIHLLESGVHVLVEKPMAFTVAEADAMVAAAARSGKYLTVDHNRWFDPVMQQARTLLASRRTRRIGGCRCVSGSRGG